MYRFVAAHHAPLANVVAAPSAPSAPWIRLSSGDTVKDRPPSSERKTAGLPWIGFSPSDPRPSTTLPSVANDVIAIDWFAP